MRTLYVLFLAAATVSNCGAPPRPVPKEPVLLHDELGSVKYTPFYDTPENRKLLAEQQRLGRWPIDWDGVGETAKASPSGFN